MDPSSESSKENSHPVSKVEDDSATARSISSLSAAAAAGPAASADDVSQMLSQNSYSVPFWSIDGVSRADGAQLAANSPCEDRFNHTRELTLWGDEKWIVSTVFDGHSGWQTADFLEKKLVAEVQSNLKKLDVEEGAHDELVKAAVTKSFVELDDLIINSYVSNARQAHIKLKEKMRWMQLALSGSCALLVLYNPKTCTLYTACTGDSRAILTYRDLDETWQCVQLSKDQKGDNEDEIARIQKQHPGEEAAKDGKVLGMAVSRAFGDSPWKIPHDLQREFARRFCTQGPMEQSTIPTPPYLTAEPVITTKKLNHPGFVVLASDGLWDECTNDEVVDLVVWWLKARHQNAKLVNMTLSKTEQPPKPAEYPPGFDFLQRWDGVDVRFIYDRTIVQDFDNVAVHLLRNACGGGYTELLEGKLAVQAPYAREIRDDMTVQVIFFPMSQSISQAD